MARVIFKLEDPREGEEPWYLEWSTVVDAPVTYGMRMDEFLEHYQNSYGTEGMRGLGERLKRVEANGHSSLIDEPGLKWINNFNRAGPNETHLTTDQIFQIYCLDRPE